MKHGTFRCRHCWKLKALQVEGQRYCGEKACQQARKNEWRRTRYAEDPDYRLNQQASTETWLASQGGAAAYHREYRQRRKTGGTPRVGRGDEARKASVSVSANRDASPGDLPFKTGRYVIAPVNANRDAYLVEIRLVSSG
jgi:phage FluMu protein Com